MAQRNLPKYSHPNSPKDFTQHQHFAILAVRQLLSTDHRGRARRVAEGSALREVLGLRRVPQSSTLCYAERRLLKGGVLAALLGGILERARELELIGERPEGTIDATGMDARHVSGHYARTCSLEGTSQALGPRLTVVGDIASHLIVAAEPSLGRSNDSPAFPGAIRQASKHLRFAWLFADVGYDAEKDHVACEELGIKALIKLNRRWFGRTWPTSRLRRRMRKSCSMRRYGRRAHAESIFSAFQRTLGSVLRARGQAAQARDVLWRVLTFDLRIRWRPRAHLSAQPGGLRTHR